MKRLVFLITTRSGSSFLRHILSPGGASIKRSAETTPNAIYYPEDFEPGANLVVDHISKLGPITAPTVYSLYAPLAEDLSFYNETYFPDRDSWRFVYLVRDPRSRIASFLNWYENKSLSSEQHTEIVREYATNFKQTAQMLLKMREDHRFKIVKFEDFIPDPLNELKEMFAFGGLEINEEIYRDRIKSYKNNSSFSDKGKDSVTRKIILTPEQMSLIDELIGQDLLDLGYNIGG